MSVPESPLGPTPQEAVWSKPPTSSWWLLFGQGTNKQFPGYECSFQVQTHDVSSEALMGSEGRHAVPTEVAVVDLMSSQRDNKCALAKLFAINAGRNTVFSLQAVSLSRFYNTVASVLHHHILYVINLFFNFFLTCSRCHSESYATCTIIMSWFS